MGVNTARMVRREQGKLHQRALGGRLARAVAYCVLAALVTGVQLQGRRIGAAVALVGAAGPHLNGAAALLGAGVGFAGRWGVSTGAQYMAAAVIIYTVAFVFQYVSVLRRSWFMPVVVMMVTGLINAFGTVSTARYEPAFLAELAMDIGVNGLLTYVYARALRPGQEGRSCNECTFYCRLILLGSVCCGLSQISIGGYASVGDVLAVLLVLAAGYVNDTAMGVCGAGVVGLVMGGDPAVLYAGGVWTAKQLAGGHKAGYLLVFCGVFSVLAGAGGTWQEVLPQLYALSVGAVLFVFYPRSVGWLTILPTDSGSNAGEQYFRNREALQLNQTAQALVSVAEQYSGAQEVLAERDVLALLDRAMDSVCEACGKRVSCRSSKRVDMLYLFMSTEEIVDRRGRLQDEDLPEVFRERCYAYKSLVLAVNYELRYERLQQTYRELAGETLRLTVREYRLFGDLLRQASEEIRCFTGGAAKVEWQVENYLRCRRLQCNVSAFYSVSKRLTLQITGQDVRKLTGREEYLEELSRLLEMRLCVPECTKDCLTMYEAEPLAVTVGIASRRKQGERVSGDQVKQFKTEQGLLYIILSDGMGTGDYAREQSCRTVENLETLLRGGVGAQPAMELLNRLAYAGNREDWGYATIDLLELNLFNGMARFYKLGAAESYLYDGYHVRAVAGNSLPVGMESGISEAVEPTEVRMKPGMIGVMVSDGVVLPEVPEAMFRQDGQNMKGLSRQLLTGDAGQTVGDDDMTVVAFSLELRK